MEEVRNSSLHDEPDISISDSSNGHDQHLPPYDDPKLLYDWIIAKDWKKAEEYLTDRDIPKEEKKTALKFQDEDNGHTPLVRAILKQSAPISLIKAMIKTGGLEVLQLKNQSDWHVLHWAAYSNHVSLEVYKLLIQKSNLEMFYATNNYNNTPLEILLEKGKSTSTSMDKIQAIIAKEQRLSNSNYSLTKTISWARQFPESEQNIILKHSFFKTILNSVFISPQYLFVSMMDLYIQFAIVLVFSFFLRNAILDDDMNSSTNSGSSGSTGSIMPTLIILIFGFIWFFIRKTTQLMSSFLKTFFLEPSNVLDIIQFVLLVGSIAIISVGGTNITDGSDSRLSTMDRVVFTSTTCISWLKLLFVIGNLYYSVAVFVAAIITVSKN